MSDKEDALVSHLNELNQRYALGVLDEKDKRIATLEAKVAAQRRRIDALEEALLIFASE